MRIIVGDLLTGRRIQNVPALQASWSEVLNRAGSISCTVTLKDPAVRRLDLRNSATPGKAFIAAVEDDTVLQAGPVWDHSFDGQSQRLTITGAGLWSYFDHRLVLPYLESDPDANPNDDDTDTSITSSYQGIARYLVNQAMGWPSGDLPIVLPSEIAGTEVWDEKGASLGVVGARLTEITRLEDGPDIQFAPRLTSDRLGVEWVMRIGTPTEPMLFAAQDVVFNVGIAGSSVSNLSVRTSGTKLASRSIATGGRINDEQLISVARSTRLLDRGYPYLEVTDTSHSTADKVAQVNQYATGGLRAGQDAVTSLSFDHDISQHPYASAFTVGDFASVRIKDNPYLDSQTIRMRITARSGTLEGKKVHVELQPEEET